MLEEYTMEETKQQQGRSPDSLIQAIDRIERLEKQLKIAVDGLKELKSMTFERYLIDTRWGCVGKMRKAAEQALNKIEELNK